MCVGHTHTQQLLTQWLFNPTALWLTCFHETQRVTSWAGVQGRCDCPATVRRSQSRRRCGRWGREQLWVDPQCLVPRCTQPDSQQQDTRLYWGPALHLQRVRERRVLRQTIETHYGEIKQNCPDTPIDMHCRIWFLYRLLLSIFCLIWFEQIGAKYGHQAHIIKPMNEKKQTKKTNNINNNKNAFFNLNCSEIKLNEDAQ